MDLIGGWTTETEVRMVQIYVEGRRWSYHVELIFVLDQRGDVFRYKSIVKVIRKIVSRTERDKNRGR